MNSRTPVPVSACSDFEVKGAIYSAEVKRDAVLVLSIDVLGYTYIISLKRFTYLSFSVPKIEAKYSAMVRLRQATNRVN